MATRTIEFDQDEIMALRSLFRGIEGRKVDYEVWTLDLIAAVRAKIEAASKQ